MINFNKIDKWRRNVTVIKNSKKFYRVVYSFILILTFFYNVFYDWQLQYFGFSELEDFGRIVFVLVISALQSLIYLWLLWIVKSKVFDTLLEKLSVNKN